MSIDDKAKGEIVVIGAGIVGASIAYHLARRGARVVIVDRTGTAAGATGKSFAWINAHHAKSEAYHRLRFQSLADYHRLDREFEGKLGLSWCGALSFDAVGEAFDKRVEAFRTLGYPAEVVSHNRFRELEPNYGHPPGRALHLSLEAAVDPVQATTALIEGALAKGARTVFGAEALAIRHGEGRTTGVETSYGLIEARQVVVAAGVATDKLLDGIGVTLPMENRPGVMLWSKPVPPTLNHVIWGDRIHLKQQRDGRLVIGEIFSEGRNDTDPNDIAEQMLADTRRHLPEIDIQIEHTTIGLRPIPQDGLPVVGQGGRVGGVYLAVMHSGITLAPVIGRMAADEILDDVNFAALEPYRPSRFQASSGA